MQRWSSYNDYTIATSVLASNGNPFECSFSVSRRTAGAHEHVLFAERLAKTFLYGGDARAAAYEAARLYIDNLIRPEGARG